MALTKVDKSVSSTPGIVDNSDATAITISSSEQVMIGTTDAGYPDYGDSLTLGDVDGGGGNAGMTIRSGTSSYGTLYFSDDTGTATGTYAGKVQYYHSDNSLTFNTSSSERMKIDGSGNITKPNNCSFSARHSTTVSNFSTNSYILCPFDTEIYDNGSNLASTGTFTAPVTGRYLLCATIRFGSVDASADYSRIIINTSNRNYFGTLLDHSVIFSGDAIYHMYYAHFIADMDANDTAEVKFYQLGGAAQADMAGDESFFQGELIG